MSEFGKKCPYLSEIEKEEPFEATDYSEASARVYDGVNELILQFKEITSEEQRKTFIRDLELNLIKPEISAETKSDIRGFFERLKNNTLEN